MIISLKKQLKGKTTKEAKQAKANKKDKKDKDESLELTRNEIGAKLQLIRKALGEMLYAQNFYKLCQTHFGEKEILANYEGSVQRALKSFEYFQTQLALFQQQLNLKYTQTNLFLAVLILIFSIKIKTVFFTIKKLIVIIFSLFLH